MKEQPRKVPKNNRKVDKKPTLQSPHSFFFKTTQRRTSIGVWSYLDIKIPKNNGKLPRNLTIFFKLLNRSPQKEKNYQKCGTIHLVFKIPSRISKNRNVTVSYVTKILKHWHLDFFLKVSKTFLKKSEELLLTSNNLIFFQNKRKFRFSLRKLVKI